MEELKALSNQLRKDIIEIVSKTGGHLGPSLGVVELTIALHYVFDAPVDKLIFDIGHQAYPHKILTGRRYLMQNLRQSAGASGFTKRSESIFDPFGAGHAATSISSALGFAVARDLKGEKHSVIAVIGDGSMSSGLAYEAMNNAHGKRLVVILNDNDMSISKSVGGMSGYLSRLLASKQYRYLREVAKFAFSPLPRVFESTAKKMEEYTKGFITGGTLFEELGFYYIGPVDGHDLTHLIPVFKSIKESPKDGPVLIHVITQKGKGYAPAENSKDRYHGVPKFDASSGELHVTAETTTYTDVFSKALIHLAHQDPKVVAITAAMPDGTGLSAFKEKFPERFFDVAIAEQHAVTFAAGLASEGFKPFVCIYSTFLQRAFDQIIHDVALQGLPVRFCIDRAGCIGADGPTHAGSFDLAYLLCIPNFVVMAPSSGDEVIDMLHTMHSIDNSPSAIRYPRRECSITETKSPSHLTIGKGKVVTRGTLVAIVSLGDILRECKLAQKWLSSHGFSTTLFDARFAKPIDTEAILTLAKTHEILITVEEGCSGGFGAHVLQSLAVNGALDKGLKVRALTLPDKFIEHAEQRAQIKLAGIDSAGIIEVVYKCLGHKQKLLSKSIA